MTFAGGGDIGSQGEGWVMWRHLYMLLITADARICDAERRMGGGQSSVGRN